MPLPMPAQEFSALGPSLNVPAEAEREIEMQPGDLLFMYGLDHVGMYVGNGMMVDAPYTGAFVRIDSMYQPGGLIGAVRPAG
jgi:cell wall-associated NlpC family hydrolase